MKIHPLPAWLVSSGFILMTLMLHGEGYRPPSASKETLSLLRIELRGGKILHGF